MGDDEDAGNCERADTDGDACDAGAASDIIEGGGTVTCALSAGAGLDPTASDCLLSLFIAPEL